MTKNAIPMGHPRLMWDAKSAWRKMHDDQRVDFLRWILKRADGVVSNVILTPAASQQERAR